MDTDSGAPAAAPQGGPPVTDLAAEMKASRARLDAGDPAETLEWIAMIVSYITVHGVGEQPEPVSGHPQIMRVSRKDFAKLFAEIGTRARAALAALGGASPIPDATPGQSASASEAGTQS